MGNRPTLDQYFIEMAFLVAKRSPCLRKQVGCVLVDNRGNVLSTGYNGPPRGWEHCTACKRRGISPQVDYQNCSAVHAEQNAIAQCPDISKISTCIVTHFPCPACLRLIHNTSCNLILFRQEEPNTDCKIIWERI